MKRKMLLQLSICFHLAAAGIAACAGEASPAAGAASMVSTNAAAGPAIPVVQPSVSVYKAKQPVVAKQTARQRRFSGPVCAVFSKDAYQLINPFAPARYGSGIDNMPKDPATGKPCGVTLIAVH